jgi:hypothetical protein
VGDEMIYINKYGVLKIVDESYDLFDEIKEETIEVLDYRM